MAERWTDATLEALKQAILDQAPNWVEAFPEGNTGQVVGVPDAAVAALRWLDVWCDELAAKIGRSEQLYGVQMEAAWEMHDVIAAVRARGMRDGLAVAAAILAESRTQ